MSVFGSLHVRNLEENFEEFCNLCRSLQVAKKHVAVLTEWMHEGSLFRHISLGTITSVLPNADSKVVFIGVTGRTWLNGQYVDFMSGMPYVVFSGANAVVQRNMHTTIFDDAAEMRAFLIEEGTYVEGMELGL